jgi:hypothetical protein
MSQQVVGDLFRHRNKLFTVMKKRLRLGRPASS